MNWYAFLALAAGLLPLLFMGIGYLWISLRQRAADQETGPGPRCQEARPGGVHQRLCDGPTGSTGEAG